MFLVFLMVGRGNTWRCGVHIFAFQSWMDFPFLSGLVIRSDVSFLNFEQFLFWNLLFLAGQGCQISARLLNFEFETENRCSSKFVSAVG